MVEVLRHDSLIVASEENAVLVAPAHDVLEDWAILKWIDEQYATHSGSVKKFSVALETHPAVRRTYRKWVSELVERDPRHADGMFQSVIFEAGLSAQFRDDTLVSLLRSSASAAFLGRHSAELFANDKLLLRRVIHLLRVACVTTPLWLETSLDNASLFHVPDGPAWACVLRLVQDNLHSFTAGDCSFFLGWWRTGREASAGVALTRREPRQSPRSPIGCFRSSATTNSKEQKGRTLEVIAKIPNADRDRFAALLRRSCDDEERDRDSEQFRELVFNGIDGFPAGRDMHEVVESTANDYLLCSEEDLRERWPYGSDLELETLFGIKFGKSHAFFPASAYRGPFLTLLRHHPGSGLDFIIAVFNHSTDWYAKSAVPSESVELPVRDNSDFRGWCLATAVVQWRLWNMYRCLSVGPDVLQSLLMAVERWLLEFGEAHPHALDAALLQSSRKANRPRSRRWWVALPRHFPIRLAKRSWFCSALRPCVQLDRARLPESRRRPHDWTA